MNESSAPTESCLTSLRKELSAIDGQDRTGTQLRSLIDNTCPELDIRACVGVPTGPGALTRFISRYLADVVHPVGRSGSDVVYSIGTIARLPETLAAYSRQRPNLWYAFAVPSTAQDLTFSLKTGEFALPLQGSTPTPDGSMSIRSMSPAEFCQISLDFLESVPEDSREELRDLISKGGPGFYTQWTSALKNIGRDVYERWSAFRIQAIADLFRARLAEAGVPPAGLDNFVAALLAARSARQVSQPKSSPEQKGIGRSPPARGRTTGTRLADDDIGATRLFALLAIGNMSINELRQLKIPLGALIDAGVLPKR